MLCALDAMKTEHMSGLGLIQMQKSRVTQAELENEWPGVACFFYQFYACTCADDLQLSEQVSMSKCQNVSRFKLTEGYFL
jgi:hypothetical protein